MSDATKLKNCDKKFKIAESKILKIVNKIDNLKLSNAYISKLDGEIKKHKNARNSKRLYFLLCVLIVVIILKFVYQEWPSSKNCLLELPSSSKTLFRGPEDCSMCKGVDDVLRLANVTPFEFEERYAYGTTPVIVTDATKNWPAIKDFNFNFFAQFYSKNSLGRQINDCFYFAYKSGLNSLQEVFSMDEKRANLSGEPWYVGWSTCFDEETKTLRSFYNRPYFLPRTAESDMVDWIFMGGPGQGAHMHVDSVRHMSWQAQIRGHKQWELAPPPECLYQCNWIKFTVAPGEILVVNTNRWYHKTNVLPGDISITIGAEYD